jgi:ADP-heptose:LPS heptosyltransferase
VRRPGHESAGERGSVLVHLASGIGNVVMATPLLIALDEMGFPVHVRLDADYPQTADLLTGWSVVRSVGGGADRDVRFAHHVPAIPPFYWFRFAREYRGRERVLARPPDAEFYRDEQAYYLRFAHMLGYPATARPHYRLPIGPSADSAPDTRLVVLAPGCKTGIMAAKRWPGYAALAERLDAVAVVGTADDLASFGGSTATFPAHCRMLAGRLTLRATAEVMAGARVVVANDSGLAHVAAAVGVPTLMLFGPTPHEALGPLPPNVRVLRAGLPCEPCWRGPRLGACQGRVDCLSALRVDDVLTVVEAMRDDVETAARPEAVA